MSEYSNDQARQMAREFKVGISILAVLSCVFIGVAFRHYRKSFVDPPSQFASQSKPPLARDQNQVADASQASILAWPAPDAAPTTRFVPPSYEEVGDAHLPFASPRRDDDLRAAPADEPAYERTSGGSFQLAAPHGHAAIAERSPQVEIPVDRPFLTVPQTDAPADPELASPPPVEPSPALLIDPATFEQDSSDPAQVQRSEFQSEDEVKAEFSLALPDLRPRALASPPQALQIDGPSRPINRSPRVEPIRAEDSFWLISQRAYGNGAYFRALYEHNREQFPEPDDLPVGASVEIPAVGFLRNNYAEICPPEDSSSAHGERSVRDAAGGYTVVGGESLFDVARFQMGQAARYVEILNLNRDVLGDRLENLPAGLRLRLPAR